MEREQLWADLVARRLLADYASGKRNTIGAAAIEQECDAALRKIIGRVDRGKLVDYTAIRLNQLAAEARMVGL